MVRLVHQSDVESFPVTSGDEVGSPNSSRVKTFAGQGGKVMPFLDVFAD
jgi:hypothetical protein